ncbi:MAG: hypothetical protein QW680_09160 [Pyrobaculum sp.]|uniref:hypothetical protein n=1 Tax=Pyrobaculum sp. TaxID=2004705 RepID=UPI00316AB9CF
MARPLFKPWVMVRHTPLPFVGKCVVGEASLYRVVVLGRAEEGFVLYIEMSV